MAKSKREIPHYYLSYTIDMTKSLKWLEEHNITRPVTERIIYAVLLIKAMALAVKDHPEFNGFWLNDSFKKVSDINIGIVISLRQGGLLAPAIRCADQMTLSELMKNMSDLVVRARSGSLRSSEVEGPSITITNLGEYGVDTVFGVIYPPQVAIVGFGKITPQKSIVVTLSADHRVSDGHRGSRFLTAIGQFLQTPEKL
jgi:pyruvate dehydrogenase E2 component (dihydrolipoamide acetyltransferase)